MKATNESTPYIDPQSAEGLEEQGLRILARFIARKLEKSRREGRARMYESTEDNTSAPTSTDENVS